MKSYNTARMIIFRERAKVLKVHDTNTTHNNNNCDSTKTPELTTKIEYFKPFSFVRFFFVIQDRPDVRHMFKIRNEG